MNKYGKIKDFFFERSGPMIISLTIIALTAISWRRWPNILIDFGRELYVPWQLVEGKILYRDIAYFNGPFSPYLNALWFQLFGVSFTTLYLCNIVIICILTFLLYNFFAKFSDQLTATMSCLTFLVVFAFGHISWSGNYNFVCPYSHEATHGIFFSILAITFISKSINRLNFIPIFFAGIFTGVVFLTKPEIFMALFVTILAVFIILFINKLHMAYIIVSAILVFIIAFLLPLSAFYLYFVRYVNEKDALLSLVGAWQYVLNTDVAKLAYYKNILGTDNLWLNLMNMILGLFIIIMPIGSALFFNHIMISGDKRKIIFLIGCLLLISSMLFNSSKIPWLLLAPPLPIVLLIVLGSLVFWLKKTNDQKVVDRLIPFFLFTIFAFFLLMKIIFRASFNHYGVFLSMPAALVLVAGSIWIIPSMIKMRWRESVFARYVIILILLLNVSSLFKTSYSHLSMKTLSVGYGLDSMKTYRNELDKTGLADLDAGFCAGYAVKIFLDNARSIIQPSETFIVFPEGVMLNYLLRQRNPTSFFNFPPPELVMFGEARIVKAFNDNPPDFFIITHHDWRRNYKVNFYGIDEKYGKKIMHWVYENYEAVTLIFNEPLKNDNFGIKIMKRISDSK